MQLNCKYIFLFVFIALSSAGWWVEGPLSEEQRPRHGATTPTSKGKPWWERRHEALGRQEGRASAKIVFLGDSITDQWAQAGQGIWKERYAPLGALNLGIGGDSTQHVLWRLERGALDGLSPRVVVIHIGTNNAWTHDAGEIADGVTAVVQQVHRRLPDAHILLLGIFPRGERRDDPMRALVEAATALFAYADRDPRVTFLDLSAALTGPNGEVLPAIMPDHLHLSPEGYRRWADAMAPTLQRLLSP